VNTDVKDLISRIKIKDPVSVAVVAALAVLMVLFAVVATGLVRGIVQQRSLTEDKRITDDAIAQLVKLQAANPVTMQQRVDEAKAQLSGLVGSLPTQEQAAAELSRYYEYAVRYNTQLIRMEADPTQASGQSEPVRAEVYQLQVRGRVPDLLRFISFLAQGQYKSFVINSIAVAPDGPSVATVRMTVYYTTVAPMPTPTPTGTAPAGGPATPAQGAPATPTTSTPAAVPTLYSP
jgi:hypothetical protein